MIKHIVASLSILLLSSAALCAEITPYGAFNYKYSHDENSSGVAYNKLEDNGSKIGLDFAEPSIEGSSIGAFAKLEVGVDTDDAASDTFDSRLAYVGLDLDIARVSVGRQSHPFTDNIGGKTSSFNVYGSSADYNYASRSSQSIAVSSELSGFTVDTLGIVDGSSSNTDAFDEIEITVSANLFGSDISVGWAHDVNNDISYWGVGGKTELGPLTVGSSYTIYDAATDKAAIEATAGYSIFTVGFGDRESTGSYYTGGVAKEIASGLTVYAEAEMADLDSGTDTTSYSLGTKYSF